MDVNKALATRAKETGRPLPLPDWLQECENFCDSYITRAMPRDRAADFWGEHAADMIVKIRQLMTEVEKLQGVIGWAQACLTALNVGDVLSESPLHKQLRQALIEYRAATAVKGA